MVLLGEPKPEISLAVENYLQAIFKLQERGERASPARLAQVMSVSAATTVGMLKRLVRQNLVRLTENREILLTPRGQELAESVVRRHRLAERMLIELLQVEWHRAHEEAHRMEHAISPQVEAKIARVLGYPTTCPFGHPIPGSGGRLHPAGAKLLAQMQEGEEGVIERVPEEDTRLLEFFEASNLKPGTALQVEEMAPYKGTVTLRVNGRATVLGLEVAQHILVSPLLKG